MVEPVEIQPIPQSEAALIVQKPKNRRFTADDILAIGRLVAKGMNEKEACKCLGFVYQSWLTFKSKAKNLACFEDVLSHVKGEIIESCVDGITAAGKRDWRALRERLSLLDRDRFGDRMPIQPVNVNVGVFAGSDIKQIAARVYSEPKRAAIADDAVQVKQITENSGA